MTLTQLLDAGALVSELTALNRDTAIRELTDALDAHGASSDPVAVAQQIIEREDILAHVTEMGAHMAARAEKFHDHPSVGDVRTFGLIMGIELVQDKTSRQPFPASMGFSKAVAGNMLKRGLNGSATTGCADNVNGDDIRFYPPLTITRQELDELMDIVDAALTETEAALL